jgi:hypothetical protein
MPLIFWDRALGADEEGEAIASICTGRDGLPSLRDWRARINNEPEFLARVYQAAVGGELIPPQRTRPPPGRSRQVGYEPADYERALEDIAAGRRGYYLPTTTFGVPSHASLDRYRKRNPDFDRRMREALATRGKRMSPPKPKATKKAATPPTAYELRRKLLDNPIFAAVDAAIPRGLPDFIRDDVRQEMVTAILAGDFPVDEVKAAVADFLSDYYGKHDIWRNVSLDQPLGDGARETFGDRLDGEAFRDWWDAA